MAGARHHTHPRFLLKGFASRVEGVKAFAWVYWKGREPQEWSIRDIAVGKDFYGREGEVTADPAITEQEPELAVLVDHLRTRPDRAEIDDPAVASLIAHLSIRTKHLRDSVLESADALIPYLDVYLSDPANIEALAIEGLLRPDAPWSQNRNLRRAAIRKAPEFVRQHRTQLRQLRLGLLLTMKTVVPSAVRNGHIKALLSSLVPEPRAEEYRSLRWFIRQSPTPLLLGDVGCLFGVSGPARYRSLASKDDQVELVSLPLSTDRMLVGTKAPSAPEVDFDALTEAHAQYSRDFFVCSQRCARMGALALKLGEKPGLITGEDMHALLQELRSQRGMSP